MHAKIGIAALLLAMAPLNGAVAQSEYPDKPIRVVTNAAGTLPDVVIRILGPALGEALGKPLIIENVAGVGGSTAAERAARSAPDGYTILVTGDAAMTTNVTMVEKLSYDPTKDFIAVAMAIDSINILAVPPSLAVSSVADLVAMAKQQPGKLTFASAGIGTSQHLGGEILKRMAAIDIVHVPYRSIAASTPDLLGGRVSMQFGNISAFLPLVRDGRLRGLAVSSLQRAPQLPELPTVAEVGYPGFEATAWAGLFVPAGTPASIVRKLEQHVIRVVAIPEIRQKFIDLGFVPMGMPGQQFGEQVKAEIISKGKIVRESGAKPN
jgi:tripartite-type tricarboxylate transporter receptor subunit TctC